MTQPPSDPGAPQEGSDPGASRPFVPPAAPAADATPSVPQGGGYPPPPGSGYPPPQPPSGFPPPTGFPPPGQGNYPPPPQGNYPPPPNYGPPPGNYPPPQQGNYPPSPGFPPPAGQGGFPPPAGQGGYGPPPGQGGFPPPPPGQGGYPQQPGQGYGPPPGPGGFPPPQPGQGGFPPQGSGMPNIDVSKVGTGDWVVIGLGVLLLIFSFFNFASVSYNFSGISESFGVNGWSRFWFLAPLLVLVVTVIYAVQVLTGTLRKEVKPLWLLYAALAALVIYIITLIDAFIQTSGADFDLGLDDSSISAGPGFGIWASIILVLAFVYFLALQLQAKGEKLPLAVPGPKL